MKKVKRNKKSGTSQIFGRVGTLILVCTSSLLLLLNANAQVPSNWSVTKSYPAGSLVLNGNGVTHIAQKAVGIGIPLSDSTYWLSLDAMAPTGIPSGTAPGSTPDTRTVPGQAPEVETQPAVAVVEVRTASKVDPEENHECCGGEDLHKEDHEKAGPSPQNPASPGFVDYKLEWERESERLKGIREEIAREKLRHQGWDLERVEQAEKIERIGTELKTIRTAMEQCMAMGEELDRELESRRKTLKGLDASLANLHNERKSVELQIEEKGRELVEMNQKYAELEKEYEPIAIKLAVPHLKGWHYEAEYGWLFVEVGSYPYVFSQRTDSWIYYKQGSHQPWEYFDYPSQKWIQWQ